jgi:transcriptional regulator with XRE-family HTH domain
MKLSRKECDLARMDTIATRIIWLRESNKLSRKSFAEKIGVNESTVGRIENGIQNPSAETLIALSHVFGVTSDWVLFGDDIPPNKDEGFLGAITDVEMQKLFLKLRGHWLKGDEDERVWIKVQLRKAFPEVAEEVKKENEEAAAADVG